jgi:hypothetical protein
MSMVPDIFKDEQVQQQYNSQGYVVLDFFSPEEIKHLEDLFHELHPNVTEGRFISDSYSNDLAYKKRASERITEVFLKHFERHLQNYTPFGSSFLYKTPGSGSELAMHQDWTIVDETRYQALNIWVPLCDVNEQNGALYVVPGSHLHILPLRAPTLPFFFSGNEKMVLKYTVPMKVKAGQSVVLNQRLIHYSPPNLSNKIRIAITSGVKTKDAQMVFHYRDSAAIDDTIEVFEQDDDFLISFDDFYKDIMNRPYLGRPVGTIKYKIPDLSKDELKTLLEKMRTTAGRPPLQEEVVERAAPVQTEQQTGIWQKIKRLVGA